MKKPFFAFLIVAVLGVLSYVPNAAEAVKPEQADLPQVSGTYDVPGHSKIKMRVFVHNAKPQPPVCIGSDPASDSLVARTGWKLPTQWTYALNVDSAPASFRGQLPAMARSAFAEWSTDSGVNFSQLANTNVAKAAMDGKNVIAWGRVSGGSTLAVTYTFYNSQTKEVLDQDTIFNSRVSWAYTPFSATACGDTASYDALNVLTHELGHWVGLNDHYTTAYENNTMFGYASKGELKKDTLSAGDAAGVRAIYR